MTDRERALEEALRALLAASGEVILDTRNTYDADLLAYIRARRKARQVLEQS